MDISGRKMISFLLLPFRPAVRLFNLFGLLILLSKHLRQSRGQSFGKRFIFIPATFWEVFANFLAGMFLICGAILFSFAIWDNQMHPFPDRMELSPFFIICFILFLPLAIITAPFVVWYETGFEHFVTVGVFVLVAALWHEFSRQLLFSKDYWKSVPSDWLGYSPQIFLVGSLSCQVIAFPFYLRSSWFACGTLSIGVGGIFFLLAIFAAFKWRAIRKKLLREELEDIYRPSGWVYSYGFVMTLDLLALLWIFIQGTNPFQTWERWEPMLLRHLESSAPMLVLLNVSFFLILIIRGLTTIYSAARRVLG